MKLFGAWCKDYSGFFDTQEAHFIDAFDNADSIYTMFFRLQALAVKCGCAGKLLFHESIPYSDEMLMAETRSPTPAAFRQAMEPLVKFGLVTFEDGIYAIADWEFNQNAPAIDAMREENRNRKARERARKNGKGKRQMNKEKVLAYLAEHPDATSTEVEKKTGVSRQTISKYRRESAPLLPAPESEGDVKNDAANVNTVKINDVKNDNPNVNFNGKFNSEADTILNTHVDGETAGSQPKSDERATVKNPSRPKNIDDRYKNTSTSTAVADGEEVTGSGIPTREEVRAYFAEMGFAVSPDRFFDVNEERGWRTNKGKPVDDWKKLAAVWNRNEHPTASAAPARTEPKAGVTAPVPSVEEVMAKYGCTRETAQAMIDEGMY